MNTQPPETEPSGTLQNNNNNYLGLSQCCPPTDSGHDIFDIDMTDIFEMDIEESKAELISEGCDIDSFLTQMECTINPKVDKFSSENPDDFEEEFDDFVCSTYFIKRAIHKALRYEQGNFGKALELELPEVAANDAEVSVAQALYQATSPKPYQLEHKNLADFHSPARKKPQRHHKRHHICRKRQAYIYGGAIAATFATVAFYLGTLLHSPEEVPISTVAESIVKEDKVLVEKSDIAPLTTSMQGNLNFIRTALYEEERPQARAAVNTYMNELKPDIHKYTLAQAIIDQIATGEKIEPTDEVVSLLKALDEVIKANQPQSVAFNRWQQCATSGNTFTYIANGNESISQLATNCQFFQSDLAEAQLPSIKVNDVIKYELGNKKTINKVVVYQENRFHILGKLSNSFLKEENIDSETKMLSGKTSSKNLLANLMTHEYLQKSDLEFKNAVLAKLQSDYRDQIQPSEVEADMNYFLGLKFVRDENRKKLVNISLLIDKYTK